jgi:hypothetical protein
MPTDLLEKPGTVQEAPKAVAPAAKTDVRAVPLTSTEESGVAPHSGIEIVLRRIFEGYEEYLGWTPD